MAKDSRLLFTTPLRGVIRLIRDELNRWLMDQTGSVSYVPYIGVGPAHAARPERHRPFRLGGNRHRAARSPRRGDADRGHLQLAEYEPEMVYLGRRGASNDFRLGHRRSLDRVAQSIPVGGAAEALANQASSGTDPGSYSSTIRKSRPAGKRRQAPTASSSWQHNGGSTRAHGGYRAPRRLLSLLVALPLL